jgi:hypothetical protein
MKTTAISRRAFIARIAAAVSLAGIGAPLAYGQDATTGGKAGALRPQRNVDAVLSWNSLAAEAFAPSQGTNPMAQSRTLAILHAAMHDALNTIEPRYATYTTDLPSVPQASVEAAVAAAAREVLVQLLPEQAALVEAAYARAVLAVPEGAGKIVGIATGRAAAKASLARRQGDGSGSAGYAYVPGSGPGEYQFTAPFDFAAQPGWGRVQPFVIDLRDHGAAAPLVLTSGQYARDVAEVQAIGHAASNTRTAEQSEIAKFWYEDSPLGWNRIANIVVRQRGLDEWEAARAFALLHFAMADGFIAGFEAKYRYRFWRPLTAIHAAATDGNARTHADPAWQPLLATPPVPDHPSTHTVLGWAAAEVLIELFGDHASYSVTSATLPGVTRHYRGFSQAAEENGMSRLYAGIHFRHAVRVGRDHGRRVGQTVAKALAPLH